MPWDPRALKRFIAEHSVVGYPVQVPIFLTGTIERQIMPQRGGFIFYKVKADRPMRFSKFAQEMKVSNDPLTLEEWTEQFAQGTRTLPAMAYDLRERLEQGEKVSRADVLFRELLDRGCIDVDQNVFCHTFPADSVSMDKFRMKPGMAVEIYDLSGNQKQGWPGVVTKNTSRIVDIDPFSPVPYMETPEALLPNQVKLKDALPYTWTLGQGVAHLLEDNEYPLPSMKLSEDTEEYILDSPIDVAPILKICKKLQPGNKVCWQQALMLHKLALVKAEVILHPFPEEMDPNEVVVDLGELPEGESEHLEWEE